MGILIPDLQTIPELSFALSGFIISFQGCFTVHKTIASPPNFVIFVTATWYLFPNQTAYDNHQVLYSHELAPLYISQEQYNGNIMALLYNELKKVYPTAVDC